MLLCVSCHRAHLHPAGVALVESAGDALVQRLLPQFESYLEPSAASRLGLGESRYDLVREGVVVLLGMMAGHLAPVDNKVRRVQGSVAGCLQAGAWAVLQSGVQSCFAKGCACNSALACLHSPRLPNVCMHCCRLYSHNLTPRVFPRSSSALTCAHAI